MSTQSSASAPTQSKARVEQALRAQDVPGAIREYRAMLAANPKDSEAWTGLGVLLYGSGHAAEAAEALANALTINATAPRAALFLALSQADMRECDKALPVLRQNVSGLPVGKLQRLAGLTLLQCSMRSGDAMPALQSAVELRKNYPGDADVLYESAELYTRMWNETANTLITAHPDSYRVHQLAAEVNEAQGNLGQAVREYRVALDENPKLPQMHYRIGQLLLRSGEPDADAKASEEFRAELRVDPQSAVSALALGEIARHDGKLSEARDDYAQAARLEPDLVDAQVGIAQTLVAEHQPQQAQAQLERVIAAHPDSAQAHYTLMLAYRQQGKLTEAATEMNTFQKLQQGSAVSFDKKLHALLTGNPADAASQTAGPAAPEKR